jgi:S1-C subfamily serine protease
MSVKQDVLVLAGSLGLAAFLGGMVVSGRLGLTQPGTAQPREAGAPAQSRPAALAAPAALPDLSPIAERALKSAANISSTTMTVSRDPFYRMVYGDQPQPSQSLGSGVVVSSDGYILTNQHVIGDSRAEVRVTLSDNREFPAKVIGIDDVSDLAVVKINASNLDTLPWGDSEKLRIAEWVLAIGNPFQLGGTVTLGIISTVSRAASVVGGNYSDFIQTDAAINPGNSGGALVNGRGELIGINSMIYSESGGNQGIGFAIPSNTARLIMKQLIDTGAVPWGSIGQIMWVSIDRETARYNRLGDQAGVFVRAISPASSATRGGLRRGDLIVSANGQSITDAAQLTRLVTNVKPGSTLKLEVLRGGQPIPLSIPVVSR